MTQFSAVQPVCDGCWEETYPWVPDRIEEEFRHEETCCFCGEPTRSGIYVREDPSVLPYPTLTKDG